MNLRRLAVVPLAAMAVFGTAAAALPGAGQAGQPPPLPALTSQALAARYAADTRAIASTGRSRRSAPGR